MPDMLQLTEERIVQVIQEPKTPEDLDKMLSAFSQGIKVERMPPRPGSINKVSISVLHAQLEKCKFVSVEGEDDYV